MAYGTYQVSDALASFEKSQNLSMVEFGENNAYVAIQQMLDAHNGLLRDIVDTLAVMTTDRMRVSGSASALTMEDADEFTTPDAQKVTAGANLGFPLNLAEIGAQWTRKYLQVATVGEINALTQAVMTADKRRVSRDIRRALFLATNYTHVDKLIDGLSIPVKRLTNADSFPIPPDPWGNSFNVATHTHYLATAAFIAANLTSLIDTVVEHDQGANVRVSINSAQEAAVRGFTGFVGYVDGRVVQANTATYAMTPLNMTSTLDRAIGVFGAAEIWVKPWVPASYVLCQDINRKPLMYRTRAGVPGAGDLQLVADNEQYPLRAKAWEREFGVGVFDRTAAAVLYTGGGAYVDPTIS